MADFLNLLKSKNLLIVEDDIESRIWLKSLLLLYFNEIFEAKDGIDGLKVFQNNRVDLILTDIKMEEMNGLVFSKTIKTISESTPIIITTAYSSDKYFQEAIKANVEMYLKKPIDIDEFLITSYRLLKDNLNNLKDNSYSYRDLKFSFETKTLTKDNILIYLTKKELLLFELILNNRDSIITFEMIEASVWNYKIVTAESIRVLVANLRKKISPLKLQNYKGLGYKLIFN